MIAATARNSRRQPSARVRWRVLRRLEDHLETPMALLGLVWLVLLIVEMVRGLNSFLTAVSTGIWIAFILDYVLRLTLAPERWAYVRRSWLTAISLVLPALRVVRLVSAVRALRVVRAARGVRLVRTVASLNRSLGALGTMMQRRGVGYVLALVIAVCFGGAAGMYALEPRAHQGGGFANYGDALWWTSMIMTTMGSGYWPETLEGRILAVLISLVAIGVFGYFTAMLASFLVGRDATTQPDGVAAGTELRALRRELAELRQELRERA